MSEARRFAGAIAGTLAAGIAVAVLAEPGVPEGPVTFWLGIAFAFCVYLFLQTLLDAIARCFHD